MIVVGLTGSIGMGKSTVLGMFRALGAATWSADEAVHRLYAEGGAAVGPVGTAFPEAVAGGAIDRMRLSKIVMDDAEKLARLEAIVHPLVAADRAAFLERARAQGAKIAVLDVPLLFETGQEGDYDAVVVVSAPAEMQRARVLGRSGMTARKLDAILARQTPDAEKRRRADYVILTDKSFDATRGEVEIVLADLFTRFGQA
ncbi:dephospho-CoA kinase [Amphiplicatus metriothermophilus]|uniref:Dephospho-CoA kinase n=1 Tax=Amphiplicatus metriothermophilus TaxID=1519374 RepID=A0A239PJN5_9PROT|nr:dephospho-CoA kinase [Amphiplicatus metriothermophilus]MBB5517650.1 dephospho-CoA kinase [Amphiplicatus metriothermophilus]SNT68016.1 dephospho-CoA kinase [Amphiplicatus metriothermophilus]